MDIDPYIPPSGPYITNAWIVVDDTHVTDLVNDVEVMGFGSELTTVLKDRFSPGAVAQFFPATVSKTLYNCYIRRHGLHELVGLREKLQELENFGMGVKCVGWWEYETGEPLGGVGSPWFQTFPSFEEEFPRPTRPVSIGGEEKPIPKDRLMVAGQARRKFV